MRRPWMARMVSLAAGLSLLAGVAGAHAAEKKRITDPPGPMIIQFGPNQSTLSASDRKRIGHLPAKETWDAADTFVVVGFADSRGEQRRNYTLSYQRAQIVRREIITSLNIAPERVLAVGRGSEDPAGDNRHPEGRARNRRVEIHLVRMSGDRLHDLRERPDPRRAAQIESLIEEARGRLHRQQLPEALALLQKARARGGDQFARWHTAYGICGFYSHAPADEVKAHLLAALRMDPFDAEARDYLGRQEAREKVSDGRITSAMGRSEQDAIPVGSDAQAHEYLRLFRVQPVSQQPFLLKPVTAWTCRDAQGRSAVYYFDRSAALAWAFSPQTPEDDLAPALSSRLVDPQ